MTDEGSVKVRTGGPVDDPADVDYPAWAGVIPLTAMAGAPEQDAEQATGVGAILPQPILRAH